MGNEIKSEWTALLSLLGCHLNGNDTKAVLAENEEIDIDKIIVLADKHKVLPLIYDIIIDKQQLTPYQHSYIQDTAKTTCLQSYRLLMLDKYIVGGMKEKGISVAILKGMATAWYYGMPEYRKSGDIDILLPEKDRLSEACGVLHSLGFWEKEKQEAHHHLVFTSDQGIDIELHTLLTGPFDSKAVNEYIAKRTADCKNHIIERDIFGVSIPMLDTAYHAYELLLHMLQHFLRSGFGLKLLCDWVCFWNRDYSKQEKELYIKLVEESGIKGFSDAISGLCTEYLGLDSKYVEFMDMASFDYRELMCDILTAEEFGKSSKSRMVSLKGDGIFDYIKEFHHQMRIYYLRAGKCILLWPFLWSATLLRFLNNNRKLNRGLTRDILKNAGNRGKIIKNMKLFYIKM